MEVRRQRGVRISKAKLQHALTESGLKTQTAVAERIADIESLESVPRGLVNKVFRGEPVDPRSVERVANALGIEAWTLYPSKDDHSVDQPVLTSNRKPVAQQSQPWRIRTLLLLSVGIVIAILLGLIFFEQIKPADPEPASAAVSEMATVSVRQRTVVVLPMENAQNEILSDALTEALGQSWRVVPHMVTATAPEQGPQLLLEQGIAERVIAGRIARIGRWLGVTLYLHKQGMMQVAWLGTLPAQASVQQVQKLMSTAAEAIIAEPALTANAIAAQEKYLTGRHHLDLARSELNVRRALTEFESALRADSDYAEAYAGLCEALISENIRSGDASRLDEAVPQCAQALMLEPENLEAQRVQAFLDRKRGRLAESQAGFESVLQQEPDNISALLGITEVYLTQYQQAGDKTAFSKALAAIERADQIDQHFWKIPFTLARLQFFSADVDAAVATAERAASLDPNFAVFNNLGIYRFCQGGFAAARDAYIQAQQDEPREFVGAQQLALLDYYQRDFAAAARGYKAALDLHEQSGIAEDYRLWGNYASALQHAGQLNAAVAAFVKTISLVEKAVAEGDGSPLHTAARAYYYEMLAWVDPNIPNQGRATLAELNELSEVRDTFAMMMVAITYHLRGYSEKAARLRAQGSQGCQGFADLPDFDF